MLGKKELRLVKMNSRFSGLAEGFRCTEGENADDV
jgi:hypothetical protein